MSVSVSQTRPDLKKMTVEQRTQYFSMLQAKACQKYIGVSFTLGDVPHLKTKYKNNTGFTSSSIELNFDSKTGILSKQPDYRVFVSNHEKHAELLTRVVQNLNLELEKKAGRIHIHVNSYQKTEGKQKEEIIYTIQYHLRDSDYNDLHPYNHQKGENELVSNPNKGFIVVSLSKECDGDAAAAVAFLQRVGVQNAHLSLYAPGYGGRNPLKPSRQKLQQQIAELQQTVAKKEAFIKQMTGALKNTEEHLGMVEKKAREAERQAAETKQALKNQAALEENVRNLHQSNNEFYERLQSEDKKLKILMDGLEQVKSNLSYASFGNRKNHINTALRQLRNFKDQIEQKKD